MEYIYKKIEVTFTFRGVIYVMNVYLSISHDNTTFEYKNFKELKKAAIANLSNNYLLTDEDLALDPTDLYPLITQIEYKVIL